MDKQEHADALRNERAALINTPDRPAKDRRMAEVDDQLKQLGVEVEDTSDHAPRERAVPKRRGDT